MKKKFVSLLKEKLTFLWNKLPGNKKVFLANQEAIKELHKLQKEIEKSQIDILIKAFESLKEAVEKNNQIMNDNQEILIYLSTVNEELLNVITGNASDDDSDYNLSDSENDDLEEESEVSSKKDTNLN